MFIKSALALAATALARVRAVEAGGPYGGPLVDAHCHLKEGVGPSIEGLLALYDAAGMQGGLLFGEPWPLATAARDRAPERIVPFLAEGYADALHPDSSYRNPSGLEQLLAGGFVHGLGEIICRHSAFRLGPDGGYAAWPANQVPADQPTLIEAYRLAGRYGRPVTVHQEWVFADELGRAVQATPETAFIWAHAGHGPSGVVGGLLDRHRNLHADLSARTPWIGAGSVLLGTDGALLADWAALLERHADRFLVGLDLFAPTHYRTEYVARLADYNRALLGQLEPTVAARIGYANAERLTRPRA